MLARILESLGGALIAIGICLGFFQRFPGRSQYLPEAIASMEAALAFAVFGGVLILAGRLLTRYVPPETEEQKERKRYFERLRQEQEKEIHDAQALMGEAWNARQTRARLRINIPQKPTDSWVGGLPHLPDDTDWPRINGVPAVFIAQLALWDLPDTAFGGLGPRDSSMVFFTDPENVHAKVLLVSGHLKPRNPPMRGKLNQLWAEWQLLWTEGEKGLSEFVPTLRYERPRWFLTVRNPDFRDECSDEIGDESKREIANAAKDAWIDGFDMTQEQYQPFDWPSARFCLDQIADMLDGGAKSAMSIARPKDKSALKAHQEHIAAVRVELAELIEEVEDLSGTMPFDTNLRDALIEGLRSVPILRNRALPAYDKGLLALAKFKSLAEGYESLARRAYTQSPDILPPPVRATLEPVWAAHAAHETLFVGDTRPAGSGIPGPDTLLDLPTSHLTGMHFGDMSRWIVDNPSLALARGSTDKADGVTTHGM